MFCIVLVFYSVAGPCIRFAVKSVEMAKMNIKPLEVRSNALGAFDRTTVERMIYVQMYSLSARDPRVALAGPMLHRFSLAP
jgi:hypothetical protein